MIRKFITPTNSNFSIILTFPNDYIGEEVEIIAFKSKEGGIFEKEKINKRFESFELIKLDTLNFKFNREEANER